MAKKRKDSGTALGENSSWRNRIPQSTRRRATTATARWRRWRQVLQIAGGLLVFCVLILGLIALLNFLRSHKADELLGTASQPLRQVYFSSNGVLDDAWMSRTVPIAPDTPLMQIDIHRLQQQLSAVGQIRTAVVERVFPDALLIRVDEHQPLLRMVITQGNERRVLLVSRQGQVYRGQGYPRQILQSLPYLAGIALRTDAGGNYLPVAGIGTIGEFLDLARILIPEMVTNWSYLDLSRYQGDPRAVGSEIRVNTRTGAQIVFAPIDFPRQFERLNEIVNHRLNDEQRARVLWIDLSLPDPVVRLAERAGKTGI